MPLRQSNTRGKIAPALGPVLPTTGMPKQRCAFEGCKNILTLTSIACRCEKKFCGAHRPAESHSCSFDYRASAKDILLKTMGKPIVGEKVQIL